MTKIAIPFPPEEDDKNSTPRKETEYGKLFEDTSKDMVHEHSGDYHFVVAGIEYKVRKLKYKAQRSMLFKIGSYMETEEEISASQDYLFDHLWFKRGETWINLTEDAMDDHLEKDVKYKPLDYLNVLFLVIAQRLLGNFTSTEGDNPQNLDPVSDERLQDQSIQRKISVT